MSMELKKYKFIKAEDYCRRVFDGTHDSPKPCKNGFKLLTSKNILSGELDKEDAYFISEEDYNAINQRSKVQQFDVLFSMIGSVGNVCLIKDSEIDFAIKNMGVFSCEDESKAYYLYYYLQSPYAKKIIESYLNGAVQKFLGLERLRTFPVPEYSENKGLLVKVLSHLDRKIVLNRAINRNLEALAKQIYDYWFVQFDFPDENGRPYKSSGGKMVWNEVLKREIPEGWSASSICKTADILSGGTPSKFVEQYWKNGNLPFFGPTDCNGNVFQIETTDHITKEGLQHCASSLFEEGVVIITARGSIGKLVILGTPMAMNQSCYALRSKNGEYEYLYFLTIQLIECLKAKGSGSVFKSIISSDIENSFLCIAEANIVTKFCKVVRPLFRKIKENTLEISELTKQRDELLPLLMNGQVTIEN